MQSDALSNGEDCLGRVCPSLPSLSALGALHSIWSLDGHMGQTLKQPHSNFVFELPGNPRLGHKRRLKRAETVSVMRDRTGQSEKQTFGNLGG